MNPSLTHTIPAMGKEQGTLGVIFLVVEQSRRRKTLNSDHAGKGSPPPGYHSQEPSALKLLQYESYLYDLMVYGSLVIVKGHMSR